MRVFMRTASAALSLAVLASGTLAQGVQLDPAVVAFKLPAQIKRTENTKSGNRTAVLQGDPAKPGPYAVLLQWLPGNMSRPHFHPNDRFFVVVKGTWWVGTGEKFDPESTLPVPAGSYVVHYANKIHYDGAKGEECIIQVWGMGPATSVPAEKK